MLIIWKLNAANFTGFYYVTRLYEIFSNTFVIYMSYPYLRNELWLIFKSTKHANEQYWHNKKTSEAVWSMLFKLLYHVDITKFVHTHGLWVGVTSIIIFKIKKKKTKTINTVNVFKTIWLNNDSNQKLPTHHIITHSTRHITYICVHTMLWPHTVNLSQSKCHFYHSVLFHFPVCLIV